VIYVLALLAAIGSYIRIVNGHSRRFQAARSRTMSRVVRSPIGRRTKAYVPSGMFLLRSTSDRPGSIAATGQTHRLAADVAVRPHEVPRLEALPFGMQLVNVRDPRVQQPLHPVVRVEAGPILAHLYEPGPHGVRRCSDRPGCISSWVTATTTQHRSHICQKRTGARFRSNYRPSTGSPLGEESVGRLQTLYSVSFSGFCEGLGRERVLPQTMDAARLLYGR
jgi:hypothetical protein